MVTSFSFFSPVEKTMRSVVRRTVGVSDCFCSVGGLALEGISIMRPNGLTSEVVRMKKMMSRLAMSENDVRSGLTSPFRFGPIRFTSADAAPYAPTAWPNSAIAPSSRMFHSSTRFWNML